MDTKIIRIPEIPQTPDLWVFRWRAIKPGKLISRLKLLNPGSLLALLVILWFIVPLWLQDEDSTAGTVDPSIWLLILLGFIIFLFTLGLCWWLLRHFLTIMKMPPVEHMVSQFKTLTSWEQLSFYLLSFALLLLAALKSIACITQTGGI